jgi:cytochrome b subunit of formate dehydrogenase
MHRGGCNAGHKAGSWLELVVPAVAGYNSAEPYWIGLPFFYWFQLVLVFVCAAVTGIVYWITESSPQP